MMCKIFPVSNSDLVEENDALLRLLHIKIGILGVWTLHNYVAHNLKHEEDFFVI